MSTLSRTQQVVHNNTAAIVRECLWVAVTLVLAAGTAWYFTQTTPMLDERAGLVTIVNGGGYRPYVYRVLVTWMLRLLGAAGIGTADGLYAVAFASTVGSVAAFRWLLAGILGYRGRADTISVLLPLVMAVLQIGCSFNMPYDTTNVMLVTLAYALMLRKQWTQYLAVFVLASLCKETSAILTIGFAVLYLGNMPWKRYIALGAVQTAIWLAVRAYVMITLGSLPGTAMEMHFDIHLMVLQHIPLAVGVYTLATLAIMATIARRWSSKPWQVRRMFVVLFPMLLVLYFVGGMPFELRVFYEVCPLGILLLFQPRDA